MAEILPRYELTVACSSAVMVTEPKPSWRTKTEVFGAKWIWFRHPTFVFI